MKRYNKIELKAVLEDHKKWVYGNGGKLADLSRANLRQADLSKVNLSGADISGADLFGANLSKANLSGANLSGANMSEANMSQSNLRHADLEWANMSGANLYGANLSRANLRWSNLIRASLFRVDLTKASLHCANLRGADLRWSDLSETNLYDAALSKANLIGAYTPSYNIPQEGSLIVWKKGREGLIKLEIPEGAKRTGSLVGRKCRAEFARVLWTETGEPIVGRHDNTIIYTPGETVYPDSYDDDPRIECTHGIHFFLTKEEAEQW